MPNGQRLQRIAAEHGAAIFAFETENRAYFAASISDRGDDYFANFAEGFKALLNRQETGRDAYFVLLDPSGRLIGRFNLVDIDREKHSAEIGYRVAERAAGRGVATAAVEALCALAPGQLGLGTITARATHDNLASRKVLAKTGFVPFGTTRIRERPATWYRKELRSRLPNEGLTEPRTRRE